MLSGGLYIVIQSRIINLPRFQCLPKESLNILLHTKKQRKATEPNIIASDVMTKPKDSVERTFSRIHPIISQEEILNIIKKLVLGDV